MRIGEHRRSFGFATRRHALCAGGLGDPHVWSSTFLVAVINLSPFTSVRNSWIWASCKHLWNLIDLSHRKEPAERYPLGGSTRKGGEVCSAYHRQFYDLSKSVNCSKIVKLLDFRSFVLVTLHPPECFGCHSGGHKVANTCSRVYTEYISK